ncbi:MAG: hypothetical protein L0Y42_04315, partial [Phycisphaerales bacterium]|nr:hypothetical protein [Phycisphaerales bacterium]
MNEEFHGLDWQIYNFGDLVNSTAKMSRSVFPSILNVLQNLVSIVHGASALEIHSAHATHAA